MRVPVRVLKPFPYGADGIHSEDLQPGDERDVHESLVVGLVHEGFVERVGAKPAAPVPTAPAAPPSQVPAASIVIPDDWAALQFMALKALANKFDPAAKNKAECTAAIEAEIAARAVHIAEGEPPAPTEN